MRYIKIKKYSTKWFLYILRNENKFKETNVINYIEDYKEFLSIKSDTDEAIVNNLPMLGNIFNCYIAIDKYEQMNRDKNDFINDVLSENDLKDDQWFRQMFDIFYKNNDKQMNNPQYIKFVQIRNKAEIIIKRKLPAKGNILKCAEIIKINENEINDFVLIVDIKNEGFSR